MPLYVYKGASILDSYSKTLINNPKKSTSTERKRLKNLEPEVLMDYAKQHYWVGNAFLLKISDIRVEMVEHVTNRNMSGNGAKARLVEYTNEFLSYTGPVCRLFPKHPALLSIENRSFGLSKTNVFLF